MGAVTCMVQCDYRMVGTRGFVEVSNAYEYSLPRELKLVVGDKVKKRKFKPTDQFAPELIAFSRSILDGTALEPDGEEGLRDVRIISAALKSAREGRPLHLSWPARRRRPELGDRILMPAIRPPSLVGVSAPAQ